MLGKNKGLAWVFLEIYLAQIIILWDRDATKERKRRKKQRSVVTTSEGKYK